MEGCPEWYWSCLLSSRGKTYKSSNLLPSAKKDLKDLKDLKRVKKTLDF